MRSGGQIRSGTSAARSAGSAGAARSTLYRRRDVTATKIHPLYVEASVKRDASAMSRPRRASEE
jgi:hypothetical protein